MADDASAPDPRDRKIAELEAENQKLRARVAELERRLAEVLGKLDEALRARKRQAAPFSKGPPKEDPKPRGRKPGELYGMHAHRPPPDRVDEVIPVPLPLRCGCGGPVDFDRTAQQFQTEIPRKPIHRRFDIDVGHCRDCGRRVQGRHPLQTSDALGAAASQLGPDAQAMAALLKDQVGVSYGDLGTIFRDFFGIPISPGGAARVVLRVAARAEAAYRGILRVTRRSRRLYPDETGWKVGGRLHWLWVFVTRTATFFAIRGSRGHDVLEEILGLGWAGETTHDGWAPYDFLEKARHQQCLGHLIRRAKLLLETATRGAVRFPRAVLRLLEDGLALRDRRDRRELSPHGLSVATGRLEHRLVRLLDHVPEHPGNLKLARHLIAHEQEIFPFLKHPNLEPTANLADQAIRPAVANRKVFGGNRDPSGARAQEILSSVVSTAAKRGIAIFDYLRRVLCAPVERRDSFSCQLLGVPMPLQTLGVDGRIPFR